ncbi:putative CXXCH cytochrome family protein [Neobacillus niacini]|uniref:cytochrome c3 family protein n=1 Tax=Neobacillus niacini TaxID=86668 RepID=UPI00285A6B93|nr:cytochrome c3 family protein [Neobacillus niacini]MDR7080044.1 putative CXXCH cytochrome family protein [Neobacillus niacini]
MSKTKLGFSLLLALILVSMLSTAAFAKSAMGFSLTQTTGANTATVTFKGLTTDAAGTVFTVTLKDAANAVVETVDVTTLADKTGSYTSPVLTVGARYSVELAYQTAPTVIVASGDVLLADYSNGIIDTSGVDHSTTLVNANETGFEGLSKKRSGQKMHGSYQNNTNSCASCHQTHTGEDHYLLFRDGTYSTCAACHDGTMGANGVFDAASAKSGTFGGSHAGNMSVHLADGTVDVKAAPGGNHTETGKWAEEFTCASCHNPHGSDSARLLKTDPAGWIKTENTIDPATGTNGGMKFSNKGIYELAALPTTNVGDYILVRQTVVATQVDDTVSADDNVFFKRAGVTADSVAISTYKWDYKAKKYIADSSLWMRSDGGRPAVMTELKAADVVKPATAEFVIVWKDGFAYSKPLDTTAASVDKATFLIGAAVDKVTNNYDYFDSAAPTYVKDSGVQMSKFCASCHTDYLSATYANADTGVFTSAHRHQTDTDRLTCVRCHYAHGTDAAIMKDSLDRGLAELTATGGLYEGNQTAALDYLKDPNPSSALKRYTGMAVCFGCHDGSIASDDTTWSNYSSLQPGVYKP